MAHLGHLEPMLGMFRKSGWPILGTLGWGLAGGFWRLGTKNGSVKKQKMRKRREFRQRFDRCTGRRLVTIATGRADL